MSTSRIQFEPLHVFMVTTVAQYSALKALHPSSALINTPSLTLDGLDELKQRIEACEVKIVAISQQCCSGWRIKTGRPVFFWPNPMAQDSYNVQASARIIQHLESPA